MFTMQKISGDVRDEKEIKDKHLLIEVHIKNTGTFCIWKWNKKLPKSSKTVLDTFCFPQIPFQVYISELRIDKSEIFPFST